MYTKILLTRSFTIDFARCTVPLMLWGVIAIAAARPGLAASTEQNHAGRSLVDMGRLLLGESSQAQLSTESQAMLPASDAKKFNIAAVIPAAKSFGLAVRPQQISLQELSQRGGAAILQLRQPDELLTVAAVGSRFTSSLTNGSVGVLENAELKKRYSGWALIPESRPGSAPAAVVDNPVRVTDVVAAGIDMKEEVRVTNRGQAPLTLAVERTSCGCTAANLKGEQTVKPGETKPISITMTTAHWGTKLEHIRIRTNDPQWPTIVLTLQARSPRNTVPSPSQLQVQGLQGRAERRFVSLLCPSGASLQQVTTAKPFIRAHMTERQMVTDGNIFQIAIDVSPAAPIGDFADEVTFHLKGGDTPLVKVPVSGSIKPAVSLEPSLIFFGKVNRHDTSVKHIVLKSLGTEPVAIKSIKSSHEALKVKYAPAVVSISQAIEVHLEAGESKSEFVEGNISITLASGAVFDVPVSAMLSAPDEAVPATTKLQVGQLAPKFESQDMNGNAVKLQDFEGKSWVLLTFFPRCFTGGCAEHLASLQRVLPELTAEKVQLLAVSVDDAPSQVQFAAKLGLTFPMVPDTNRTLCLQYGAAAKSSDLARRMTVLVDARGIVRAIDTDVQVQSHGTEMLAAVRALKAPTH